MHFVYARFYVKTKVISKTFKTEKNLFFRSIKMAHIYILNLFIKKIVRRVKIVRLFWDTLYFRRSDRAALICLFWV